MVFPSNGRSNQSKTNATIRNTNLESNHMHTSIKPFHPMFESVQEVRVCKIWMNKAKIRVKSISKSNIAFIVCHLDDCYFSMNMNSSSLHYADDFPTTLFCEEIESVKWFRSPVVEIALFCIVIIYIFHAFWSTYVGYMCKCVCVCVFHVVSAHMLENPKRFSEISKHRAICCNNIKGSTYFWVRCLLIPFVYFFLGWGKSSLHVKKKTEVS